MGRPCSLSSLAGFEQKCFCFRPFYSAGSWGYFEGGRGKRHFSLRLVCSTATNPELIYPCTKRPPRNTAFGTMSERCWQLGGRKHLPGRKTRLLGWIDLLASAENLHLIQLLCLVAQNQAILTTAGPLPGAPVHPCCANPRSR